MATVAKLRSVTGMSIPELRQEFDYPESEETKNLALRLLEEQGQVCPDGKPYGFGTVVAQHTVGPYTIIESKRDSSYHGQIPGKPEEYGEVTPEMVPEHSFSSFVEGERTSHSFPSLDEALIHAIAYRNLGNPNSASWAAKHAAQIVGAQDQPKVTS